LKHLSTVTIPTNFHNYWKLVDVFTAHHFHDVYLWHIWEQRGSMSGLG
jgi:hypothetical protein